MAEIVVAVFGSADAAEAAMRDLESAGIPANTIRRYRRGDTTPATASDAPTYSDGLGISRFWSWLIGEEPQGRELSDRVPSREEYERSLAAGGTVLAVPIENEHAERVLAILHEHAPQELEERGAADAGAVAAPVTDRPPRISRVRRYPIDEDTGHVW